MTADAVLEVLKWYGIVAGGGFFTWKSVREIIRGRVEEKHIAADRAIKEVAEKSAGVSAIAKIITELEELKTGVCKLENKNVEHEEDLEKMREEFVRRIDDIYKHLLDFLKRR